MLSGKQLDVFDPLTRALGDLDARDDNGSGSRPSVWVTQRPIWPRCTDLAAEQLYQQERIRRSAIAVAVGLWDPFTGALQDLDAQFQLARIEAERLNFSTAKLANTQRLAALELFQNERLRRMPLRKRSGFGTPLPRRYRTSTRR